MTDPLTGEARRSEVFDTRNSALRPMSEWFRAFARETRTPAATALDFELCLNELMANVIAHAQAGGGSHRLEITLERRSSSLAATPTSRERPMDASRSRTSGRRTALS